LTKTVQESAWKLLKGLRPRSIDLNRLSLIHQADLESLKKTSNLNDLLPRLGLNDEGLEEFPVSLHEYCGNGLLIWQYPVQFGPYLSFLAQLKVQSYLELGIRHGGSYVVTVEFLERFNPLTFSIGVDIIPCASMQDYQAMNTRSSFICINSQSPEFLELLASVAPIDLVFIDSHHEESQCRREFAVLSQFSQMIAFHDVSNIGCPGIQTVWREIKQMPDWTCHEFIDQYPGLGPFMGIGLAIKNTRLTPIN
jgi:cephalosporin hydroxylase